MNRPAPGRSRPGVKLLDAGKIKLRILGIGLRLGEVGLSLDEVGLGLGGVGMCLVEVGGGLLFTA